MKTTKLFSLMKEIGLFEKMERFFMIDKIKYIDPSCNTGQGVQQICKHLSDRKLFGCIEKSNDDYIIILLPLGGEKESISAETRKMVNYG